MEYILHSSVCTCNHYKIITRNIWYVSGGIPPFASITEAGFHKVCDTCSVQWTPISLQRAFTELSLGSHTGSQSCSKASWLIPSVIKKLNHLIFTPNKIYIEVPFYYCRNLLFNQRCTEIHFLHSNCYYAVVQKHFQHKKKIIWENTHILLWQYMKYEIYCHNKFLQLFNHWHFSCE